MMKPETTPGSGPCPRCQGQKKVKQGTQIVPCPACLGKGTSGYIVKGR